MAGIGFLPPVILEIQANATEALVSMKEVNAELTRMEAHANATGASLSKMEKSSVMVGKAMMVTGVAAFALGAIAVEAAMKSEEAFTRLNKALDNSGNGSVATKEQFKGLVESNVKLGFTTVETANALGTLVTATGKTSEATALLSSAQNFARYSHISLSSAADTMAKATQGSAKAFKELGITLDTHLPKQEAINKAFDQLNDKLSGQSQAYLTTFAGKMSVLKAQTEASAESLGNVLIPVLTKFLDLVNKGIEWIKNNADALKMLGLIVLTAAAAFKTYEITLVAVNAIQKIQIALALASAEGIGTMRAAMLLLNDAMKANMIGIIVTALVAVGAMFIYAWNHSETFRKGVKIVADSVITFLANMIRAFGGLIEIIANLVTGQLQIFLKVLSYLPGVGKYAKEGLKFIRDGIEGIGNTADTVANKVEGFKKVIDNLDVKKTVFDVAGGNGESSSGTGKSSLTGYTGANTIVKGAKDTITPIIASIQNQLDTAVNKYNESIANAKGKYNEAILAADTAWQEKQNALDKDWQDKQATLLQDHNDALAKINAENAQKIVDIQQTYADKLKAVVQKSIDELTGAFANATNVDIGKMFTDLQTAGDASGEALVASMTEKLKAVQKLSEDASTLAGKGFSQAFIEQVVAQGPVVGDQLTQSILSSTPDQVNQMQSLFQQLTDASNNGVTALATSMSQPGKLATESLNAEYQQTQEDLQTALAEQKKTYDQATADENSSYQKSLASAQAIYDKATADNLKSQQDAYAAAQKALLGATAAAEGALAVSLDNIQKTFDTKLGNVKTTIQSTIDAIKALQAAMASVSMASAGGGGGYVTPSTQTTPSIVGGNQFGSITINNNNNGVTTSPAEIATATLNAVILGQTQGITSNGQTTSSMANKINQMSYN